MLSKQYAVPVITTAAAADIYTGRPLSIVLAFIAQLHKLSMYDLYDVIAAAIAVRAEL
jgi:hypothetical protein